MGKTTSDRRLRRSLSLVTLSGCLCMIFVTGVTCPLQTEFFRAIGATEFHFGLLGGVPMAMMFMNFIAAFLVNRVSRRKTIFIVLVVLCRLLILPIAFLPLLFPEWGPGHMVGVIIVLLSVSNLLAHLSPPFWFSWMADLIPKRVLNRYWGQRQFYLQMVWVAGFLAVALFIYLNPLPVLRAYPLLATIGVAAGVVDILLFIWVDEPPNQMLPEAPMLDVLAEPFRHVQFRSYLLFRCIWFFSVMFAASFMQLYVLKVLAVPLWQATLIWCLGGIANGFAARFWGRMADRHGHKPVMVICDACKPIIVIVLCLVTPAMAVPVLAVAFFLDGIWNAGNDIAGNGFLLKIAPRENRSMFIAAIAGLAGICGGIGALTGGFFLELLNGFQVTLAGRQWNNYQLLFFLSIFMRLACLLLLRRVKEPTSHGPMHVLSELRGLGSLRAFTFPVGFYRRLWPEEVKADSGRHG